MNSSRKGNKTAVVRLKVFNGYLYAGEIEMRKLSVFEGSEWFYLRFYSTERLQR